LLITLDVDVCRASFPLCSASGFSFQEHVKNHVFLNFAILAFCYDNYRGEKPALSSEAFEQ